MNSKIVIIFCVLLICNVNGFVKRDATQASHPNILEPVERNLNQFQKCLDQSLATAAEQVNVKQLQPVFDALGDQLNRFSKAFEILTASPQKTPES